MTRELDEDVPQIECEAGQRQDRHLGEIFEMLHGAVLAALEMTMRTALLAAMPVATLILGCAGAAGTAAVNTAFALGASAVSRASGGCFAACTEGTTCNPKTGYCDAIPCGGRCKSNEHCESSGPVERCVLGSSDALKKAGELATPQ